MRRANTTTSSAVSTLPTMFATPTYDADMSLYASDSLLPMPTYIITRRASRLRQRHYYATLCLFIYAHVHHNTSATQKHYATPRCLRALLFMPARRRAQPSPGDAAFMSLRIVSLRHDMPKTPLLCRMRHLRATAAMFTFIIIH